MVVNLGCTLDSSQGAFKLCGAWRSALPDQKGNSGGNSGICLFDNCSQRCRLHWLIGVVLEVGSSGQQPQGNSVVKCIFSGSHLKPQIRNSVSPPWTPYYLESGLTHLSPEGLPQLIPGQAEWQGIHSGSPPALVSGWAQRLPGSEACVSRRQQQLV